MIRRGDKFYWNNVLMRGKIGYGALWIVAHADQFHCASDLQDPHVLFRGKHGLVTFMYCNKLSVFNCKCNADQLKFLLRDYKDYYLHDNCTCNDDNDIKV